MNASQEKLNALIQILATKKSVVVSADKARQVVREMLNVVPGCRADIGTHYVWCVEIEGVGTLRVVVPRESWRCKRDGCVVAFDEATPGAAARYIQALWAPRPAKRLNPHQSLQARVMASRIARSTKMPRYRGYRSC